MKAMDAATAKSRESTELAVICSLLDLKEFEVVQVEQDRAKRLRTLTLVPTRMYFSGPRAKVEIALARGKDVYDKREAIRKRDMARDVQRELREVRR